MTQLSFDDFNAFNFQELSMWLIYVLHLVAGVRYVMLWIDPKQSKTFKYPLNNWLLTKYDCKLQQ